jgi:hypothetical protein
LEECLKQGQRLYKRFIESESVYFHKEILTLSKEKRPMELWTLTGKDERVSDVNEELIPDLFPFHEGDKGQRAHVINKPIVFLTSRVHPGETPASFVLNGIINFLTNEKSE